MHHSAKRWREGQLSSVYGYPVPAPAPQLRMQWLSLCRCDGRSLFICSSCSLLYNAFPGKQQPLTTFKLHFGRAAPLQFFILRHRFWKTENLGTFGWP